MPAPASVAGLKLKLEPGRLRKPAVCGPLPWPIEPAMIGSRHDHGAGVDDALCVPVEAEGWAEQATRSSASQASRLMTGQRANLKSRYLPACPGGCAASWLRQARHLEGGRPPSMGGRRDLGAPAKSKTSWGISPGGGSRS